MEIEVGSFQFITWQATTASGDISQISTSVVPHGKLERARKVGSSSQDAVDTHGKGYSENIVTSDPGAYVLVIDRSSQKKALFSQVE